MLKKFFLSLIALFFILFGSLALLMGYVLNKPSSLFHAFQSITQKVIQDKEYEESEEFFLQGMKSILIQSRKVDICIHTHAGNTLKVLISGKIPRLENGPFILSKAAEESLELELHEPIASHWFQVNINGEEITSETDSHLRADIYLPVSYKDYLSIENEEGFVELEIPQNAPYELDLQSIAGKIENQLQHNEEWTTPETQIGKIKIWTQKGPIKVHPIQ